MGWLTLITTGGTIASQRDEAQDHAVASITGADLAAGLGRAPGGPKVRVDDFLNINSCAMSLDQSFALARRIGGHLAEAGCEGVVVTHGTDTMEESAWLADLTVPGDKPVVFTGAQRSADEAAPDGPRNLADAIRLAGSPLARGLGAMIVFEQHFHAARDVTKAHTSRVDTFVSFNHGKLGEIDGDRICLSRRPVLRKTFAADRIDTRVDLIRLALGADDRLIRHAAASGASAIVLEGFGRGNANPPVAAAVRDIIAAGTPVIVASRCAEGRVRPVYGNGGGKDLEKAGAIFAGDLAGPKARILAAVLLGAGADAGRLRQAFDELGG